MRPLLFTSIPPRLGGVPFEPCRPDDPQAIIIRSWIAAGFQPVSINVEREVACHPRLEEALRGCGVDLIVVPPAPGGESRGPHCPFGDFLRALECRAGDTPAAITNADIRLADAADQPLAALVSRLGADEFRVAQRTDLASRADGSRRATVHPHGFDFLAFHGSWVGRIADCLVPGLAFGLPWWDHYLPLSLIARGCRARLVHPGWFLHEAHVGGWGRRHYCRLGRLAMRHFAAALGRASDPATAPAWLEMLDLETVPGGLTGPLADRVRRIATHESVPDWIAVRILGRLAAANMRLILQATACGPEPPANRHR